jgi:hypothetical protein
MEHSIREKNPRERAGTGRMVTIVIIGNVRKAKRHRRISCKRYN